MGIQAYVHIYLNISIPPILMAQNGIHNYNLKHNQMKLQITPSFQTTSHTMPEVCTTLKASANKIALQHPLKLSKDDTIPPLQGTDSTGHF